MDMIRERETVLWNELLEYEKNNAMTKKEKKALRDWVQAGNSVYDNASMIFDETGGPMEFLSAYRLEEEINKELELLSPREKKNYIARITGEDTIDNLREDLDHLSHKVHIYEQILRSYGLLEIAKEELKYIEEKSKKIGEEISEWIKAHPETELPFEEEETAYGQI